METLPAKELERFWSKVEKSSDCWIWTAGLNSVGYGKIRLGGRHVYAHRVSYSLTYGTIPPGMVIDHMCHNSVCVNPAHLQAVTQKQNMENRAGPARHSKTGVRGVSAHHGRYRAQVAIHGRPTHVGTYDTVAEAEEAVISARMRHYTNNLADRPPR